MRTRMLRGVVLVAAVLALSVATAHAQSLVKGRVVDAQNKPVEGAVIHFEQKDANYKRDTKSDKKGEFLFVGLPTGEYKVTATKETLTDTQTARISGAEPAFVSFQLRAPAPAGATAAANPTAGLSAITNSAKAGGDDAEAIKPLITSALESYNANKYAEAIPKFNDLIKKLPACSDCYMYLSVSYFATNEPEAAESALKKSIEIKPTPDAYNMLANLYNQQKKFELGAAAAKKATELSEAAAAAPPVAAPAGAAAPAAAAAPPPPSPEMNSANAYNDGVKLWNDNKYADAKAKFEEAAKTNPQNADAQYMIGMANLNLGQIPAARAAFQSYLKISPEGDKAAQVKTFLTQLPK